MNCFMRAACAGLMTVASATTVPALAADFPLGPYSEPAVASPAFTWSGFYAGLNAGYSWATTTWSGAGSDTFGINGWFGGGTAGYNFQNGVWVWGLEGDIDYTGIKGADANVGGACGGLAGGCETRNSWLATTRGRIGFGWNHWMPFLTGGAAFGDIKMTPDGGGTQSTTTAGWAAGAGFEYRFLGPWSAKVEYLYVDLGKATCGAPTCAADTAVSFKTNLLRAGVNYRF